MERNGIDQRIDHRSNAARGLDEQPTIHEGATARTMESKGIISDRCELNRQIKADNALLRALKAEVRKLVQTIRSSIPALAEALETIRKKMIVFRYQLRHIGKSKREIRQYLAKAKPELTRYTGVVQEIKEKNTRRKALVSEKKSTSVLNFHAQKKLAARIEELTEELEELRSEKERILQTFDCGEDISGAKKRISLMEQTLKRLDEQEDKYADELTTALAEYTERRAQATPAAMAELLLAQLDLRPEMEQRAYEAVQKAYGDKYDLFAMIDSKRDIADLLGEESEPPRSVREQLRKAQEEQHRGEKHQDNHHWSNDER